jgi:hypothetical protein
LALADPNAPKRTNSSTNGFGIAIFAMCLAGDGTPSNSRTIAEVKQNLIKYN